MSDRERVRWTTLRGTSRVARVVDRTLEAQYGCRPKELLTLEAANNIRYTVPAAETSPV